MAEAFTWGAGGAKLTPEQLALARALLNRKKSQGVDTSPVGHWTAGAARIADAFGDVLQERRLNNQQAENDQYNVAQTEPLIAALSGGGTAPVSAPVAASPVDSAVAPSTVDISGDKQTFIQSLLPAAIEEGARTGVDPRIIVAQAAQETGWGKSAPGNNYFGIKSHGQSGGQTLATNEVINGKTVRINDSFRQFASPADSVRGYGDFILQNPRYEGLRTAQGLDGQLQALQASGYATDPNYSRSVGAIARSIQLPQNAAAAIETASPSPSFRGSDYNSPMLTYDDRGARVERPYTDPAVSVQPNAMAPPMPAPVEVAARPIAAALTPAPQQAAPPPNVLAQALRVMADPRANENTKAVAQALIQRQQAQEQAAQEQSIWQQRQAYQAQQQASDPLRQLQIQKAQAEVAQMQNPNANVPDAVKSLDLRAQRAGLQPGSPEYNNFFITQGVKPPANVGAPPAGYQIVYDASGNPTSMAPIPGSPAAMEAEAQKKVLANQQSGKSTSSDVITNAARLARETLQAPGLPATGMISGALSGLPETNAAELRRQVGVLTSNATVENLNAMRAASPTGGALGSVTEKEGAMLAAKSGALDPNSPNFARDLEDYERTLLRVVHGQTKGDEIFNQTRKPVSDDIRAAQDAIAKGAPREMVIKRLQDAGIDTEGL